MIVLQLECCIYQVLWDQGSRRIHIKIQNLGGCVQIRQDRQRKGSGVHDCLLRFRSIIRSQQFLLFSSEDFKRAAAIGASVQKFPHNCFVLKKQTHIDVVESFVIFHGDNYGYLLINLFILNGSIKGPRQKKPSIINISSAKSEHVHCIQFPMSQMCKSVNK